MKLIERKKELEAIIKSGKRVALYIVEDEKSAQFRYRVKNVRERLAVSKKWGAVYFLRAETKEVSKMLPKIDLMVIERQTDKTGEIGKLISVARAAGVKVLMDLDDLIFDYTDLPVLMWATGSRNVFYWMGYFWGIRRIAKKVDGFICTNDFLARKLKRSFRKPVKVVFNSLNQEQIKESEKIVASKNERKDANKDFWVGYFSGSPTHAKDFQMVEPELIKFLEKYNDTKLQVVGYMKFSKRMQDFASAGRVEIRQPVDYLKLQDLMADIDVNIAPLLLNDFTNSKSELKYFEAAVVETTTIASPTYSFRQAISDGENGFLAKEGKWYDRLEYLYRNPKKNREIALAAKQDALLKYYGKRILEQVEEAYEFFSK